MHAAGGLVGTRQSEPKTRPSPCSTGRVQVQHAKRGDNLVSLAGSRLTDCVGGLYPTASNRTAHKHLTGHAAQSTAGIAHKHRFAADDSSVESPQQR